ncbi:MAG: hypothetical protein KDA68_10630 [Planctomycetaceae bacterium]|nr:hypothetical protein [Planctomycetaceae bacterium]
MQLIISIVFLVILALLVTSGTAWSDENALDLARFGSGINSKEKLLLEEQVAKNPYDIDSRTKLLGYYFNKGRKEPDAKSARERHVLWLIENAPESEVLRSAYGQLHKVIEPEGYELAKQAWLRIISESPDNLSTLRNASRYFLMQDHKISEELLLRGQSLDPTDPEWSASLGRLYSLELISLPEGPLHRTTADKAFRQLESAYGLSDPIGKDALLSDLAKTAFAAGLMHEAKKWAEETLENDSDGWNRGNRFHHGNLILGRIALAEGNVDEAKSRLLLAGRTEGSPQLDTFGPNMQLAKELLERGEKEVVLEYFDLCNKFWVSPRRNLEQWIEDVKSNRIPNFGGNLWH